MTAPIEVKPVPSASNVGEFLRQQFPAKTKIVDEVPAEVPEVADTPESVDASFRLQEIEAKTEIKKAELEADQNENMLAAKVVSASFEKLIMTAVTREEFENFKKQVVAGFKHLGLDVRKFF